MPGLKITASMPSRAGHRLVRSVRCRMVANVDGMGLLVRMRIQCSPGNAHKASSVSRSYTRHSIALGYLGTKAATSCSKASRA